MKCKAIACEVNASIRGFCCKHYWRRRAHGEFGRVDAGPTLRHLKALRKAGWTWTEIDTASNTVASAYLASGRTKRVLRDTEAKILAVKVTQRPSRMVSVVGIRRRVEALAWMGWPIETVAKLAGMSVSTLCPPPKRKVVLAETVARLEAVYAKHSGKDGPSIPTAKRAVVRGYQPPMAWEYADIDDPKAKPFQGFYAEEAM